MKILQIIPTSGSAIWSVGDGEYIYHLNGEYGTVKSGKGKYLKVIGFALIREGFFKQRIVPIVSN